MRRLCILLPALLAFLVGASPAHAWTWPVDGPVLQPFSLGDDPYAGGQHRGIDIGAASGASVSAPAGGTVSFAGTVPSGGRTVTIKTEDGYAVTLVHLGTIGTRKGAAVEEGEIVGTVGPSGETEHAEPYVHLGVRVASEPEGYVDPLAFLPLREIVAPPDEAPATPLEPESAGGEPAGDAPGEEPASGAPGEEPRGEPEGSEQVVVPAVAPSSDAAAEVATTDTSASRAHRPARAAMTIPAVERVGSRARANPGEETGEEVREATVPRSSFATLAAKARRPPTRAAASPIAQSEPRLAVGRPHRGRGSAPHRVYALGSLAAVMLAAVGLASRRGARRAGAAAVEPTPQEPETGVVGLPPIGACATGRSRAPTVPARRGNRDRYRTSRRRQTRFSTSGRPS